MQNLASRVLVLALAACLTSCVGPVAPPDHESARALPGTTPGAGAEPLAAWHALLQDERHAAIAQQLGAVNGFFNALRYVSDRAQWRTEDYWATPLETLSRRAGDCEDLTIGKYFTLRALGVPDATLRMTYVIAGQPTRAHMVLAYYADPGAEPLILDTLEPEIRPASLRPDLAPVFGFNSGALWVGGQLQTAVSGPATRIAQWRGLLRRMQSEPRIASI